jgi:hypothetical protein
MEAELAGLCDAAGDLETLALGEMLRDGDGVREGQALRNGDWGRDGDLERDSVGDCESVGESEGDSEATALPTGPLSKHALHPKTIEADCPVGLSVRLDLAAVSALEKQSRPDTEAVDPETPWR